MKTLTVNVENSQLFDWFKYPAGEMQVRIKPEHLGLFQGAEVLVKSRIKNSDDLIKTALLGDCISSTTEAVKSNLFLPYLPYGRADRRFTDGDCFGLAVFLRTLSPYYDEIITLDRHSDAFSVVRSLNPNYYIFEAIGKFAKDYTKITVLFPDEGAKKRYEIPSSLAGLEIIVKYATKKRNPVTGVLEGFDVPDITTRKCLIVDDICDGGGTFLGIAERIFPGVSLGLYVTHGIFSKGIDVLSRFDKVFTTDSYCDLTHDKLTVFNVLNPLT